MKIVTTLIFILASSLAHADDVAVRVARQRSIGIVDAIAKGERDLKKSFANQNENQYLMTVSGPMARRLKWWRELQEKNPTEFRPYLSCLSAGVAFNLYGTDLWEERTSNRSLQVQDGEKKYKAALGECKQALKSNA